MPHAGSRRLRAHIVFASLFASSGCAGFDTYNKLRYDTAGIGETTYVDAKQRAVFAIPQSDGKGNWQTRICAEPSPDALSALAASGNGSLSFAQKASAQAAVAITETASSIGLRTQSIQLMRDAMYRMCEGVASGTLSQTQFETLFRRFQSSMVAILAIEQLTGVIKAGGAQLSTTAGVGASKEIAELAENTAKAQDTASTADANAKTAAQKLADATGKRDAYLKANGSDADKLTDAQKTELAPLQQAVTDAATANAAAITTATETKERLAIYRAGMEAVHGGDLATSGTASIAGDSGGQIDASSAKAIAEAVKGIFEDQLNKGFVRDACATLFDAEIDGRVSSQAAKLQETCDEFAKVSVSTNAKQADTEAQTSMINAEAAAHYSADYGAYLLKWGGGTLPPVGRSAEVRRHAVGTGRTAVRIAPSLPPAAQIVVPPPPAEMMVPLDAAPPSPAAPSG